MSGFLFAVLAVWPGSCVFTSCEFRMSCRGTGLPVTKGSWLSLCLPGQEGGEAWGEQAGFPTEAKGCGLANPRGLFGLQCV